VTDTDDAPLLTGAASGTVFEAGLASATDPFGSGTDAGGASDPTAVSGAIGIDFGADGPAAAGRVTGDIGAGDTQAEFSTYNDRGFGNILLSGSHTVQATVGEIYAYKDIIVTDAKGPFTLQSIKVGIANGDNAGQNSHAENLILTGYDAAGNV